MTTRRWSHVCLSTVAVVAFLLSLGGCGTSSGSESDLDASEKFAELMKRPDIDEVVARYDQMYNELREQLSRTFPALQWHPTTEAGGGSCGRDFSGINRGTRSDAVTASLSSWVAPGSLPDDGWGRAVSIMDTIVRGYGFTSGAVAPVNRSGEHEADFYDPYDATLIVGTAVNTTMSFWTGCHLTAQAKQRGHLAPAPTY
jgi:hypothetical protein